MMRQHDFEQLPVQPLRARLDLAKIEARLDVEVIGAGAMLEIEVDQAGRGFLRVPLLRRSIAVCTASVVTPAPPTAGRKVKICDSLPFASGRRFGNARTGLDQIDRRHRLDQKIRHPHLHETPGDIALETPRYGDDRRPTADAGHESFECLQLQFIAGIEIDDDDTGAIDINVILIRKRSFDDVELNLRAGAERRAHAIFERRIGGHDDHAGPNPGGCRSADAHPSDSHNGRRKFIGRPLGCCVGLATVEPFWVCAVVLLVRPCSDIGSAGGVTLLVR